MSSQKYFRKSRFEKFKRIRALKNHQTIKWLQTLNPTLSQNILDPTIIPKPISDEGGSYPESTKAIVKTAIVQSGGQSEKLHDDEKEAISQEPIEVEGIFLDKEESNCSAEDSIPACSTKDETAPDTEPPLKKAKRSKYKFTIWD